MLSVALCNVNNSISQHTKNVYTTWKKSKKPIKLCCNCKTRKLHCNASQRPLLFQYIERPKHLRTQHGILLLSAQHVYLCFRSKFTHCLQSVFYVQSRNYSRKQNWIKVIKAAVTSAQDVLFVPAKLSYASGSAKSKFRVLHLHKTSKKQNSIYFSEVVSNSSSSNTSSSFDSSSNITNSDRDNVDANEHEPFESVDATEDESQPKHSISQQHLKDVAATKVQRSQYEHLATALTRQAEIENNEKSIFSSVKSFMEIPVNSFFSFVSRTSLFDSAAKPGNGTAKANNSDSTANGAESNVRAKVEKKVAPPPTLLETLYQYIPYISTSNKQDSNTKDTEKKEASRLKAEKELLMQKVNINNRTRYLINAIREANSLFSLCQLVEELKDHLLRFPDTRITAVKENAIKEIMHVYRTTQDVDLGPDLRMCLAMLGAVDPPKQKGIRVLSIDGGGSRGIASVEIFRQLVEMSGRPINEMFDYICGVSTGAILGFLMGIKKVSIDDLGLMYRELSSEIFQQNRLVGTGTLVLSHAYYNTESYQKVLKKIFGNELLIETAALEDVPKCSAVSTLVNRLPLKPFIWRNYSIVPGTRHTHWGGTCRATMWEAIRASSAAPGYFEEFKKGYNIHQDGGVLTNNPTGVALNECRLLWPHAPIQCVVSVGTGRYEPAVGPVGDEFSSLKDKLLKFVDSATSVTEVHTVMHDLLPAGTYFRFNPFIREPLLLDECRSERLDMLVQDARDYIERNEYKFKVCVDTLLGNKTGSRSKAGNIVSA